MKKIILSSLLSVAVSLPAMATNSLPVSSSSCAVVQGTKAPFMLVLKKGENVFKSIQQCAADAKLNGATFTGLGAVDKATLRYFDHKTKKYHKEYYLNFLELLVLNGNITMVNGKRTLHIHSVLSDKNFKVFGGDMENATVAATAEIQIQPLSSPLVKKADVATGLNLIQTQ